MFNRKTTASAMFYFVALALAGSHARAAYLEGIPTNWRLQNYVPDGIAAYYTGSSCSSLNGILQLNAAASQADKNRFWATISLAKAAGKTVFVYYDETKDCAIQSFGLKEGG